MLNFIFGDIGKTLKIIAKLLFVVCVLLGFILIVFGLIKVLGIHGGHSRSEIQAWYTVLYCGIGLVVGSLGTLPLYALGEIASDLKKSNNTGNK